MSQDSAAREAMDNYMMQYFSRFPTPFDARFLQAYPMMSPQQMPLLLQPPAAEAPFTKVSPIMSYCYDW